MLQVSYAELEAETGDLPTDWCFGFEWVKHKGKKKSRRKK